MTRLVAIQQPGASRRPPNFLTFMVVLPQNRLLPRCDLCSNLLEIGKLGMIWVPRVLRIMRQYTGHLGCLLERAADAPLDVHPSGIQ